MSEDTESPPVVVVAFDLLKAFGQEWTARQRAWQLSLAQYARRLKEAGVDEPLTRAAAHLLEKVDA